MKHYQLLDFKSRAPRNKVKPSVLRKQKQLPGVIFGKGMDSISIQIDGSIWKKVAAKGDKIFDATVDGKNTILVALEEVAKDPLSDEIVHISFHKINKNEDSIITVPIHLIGHVEKGVIAHVLNEVEIKGKPADLPGHLDVDISKMIEGDYLTIADIPLPKGVKILEEADHVFVTCQHPKKFEEPVTVVEAAEVPLVGEEEEAAPAEAPAAKVIPLKSPTKKAS